ncbi:hypothetical protein J27TS7_34490 [Paenibacillus dendritiformis]|nr:hypothetical protein J27TS7_34490 [Paenibacillus dendritiformis]
MRQWDSGRKRSTPCKLMSQRDSDEKGRWIIYNKQKAKGDEWVSDAKGIHFE